MRTPWPWLVVAACFGSPPAPPMTPLAPPRAVPATAVEPAAAHRLAATERHTCAIDDAGDVWCWGLEHQEPARVPGVAHAVSLAAHGRGTCALLASGGVTCWGAGPLDVPTADVTALAAGDFSSCAVVRDGAVQCWGSGVMRPIARGAVEVAIGMFHACARLRTGRVRCWGNNNAYGALGRGDEHASSGSPAVGDVTAIAAGDGATCAIRRDGTVACWGDAGWGALGADSGHGGHAAHPEPVQVPGVTRARALAMAKNFGCALDAAGGVTCWGTAWGGVAGVPRSGELVPTKIDTLDRPIAELATSGTHTCARAVDGTLWCWGSNEAGELGVGPRGARFRPMQVVLGAPAPPIALHPPTPRTISTLPTGGRRVAIALDGEESFVAAGLRELRRGYTSFGGGVATLHPADGESWATDELRGDAQNMPGWAVEARFRLDDPCEAADTGFAISDGVYRASLLVGDHTILLEPSHVSRPLAGTDAFHTYRLEVMHGQVTASVDGAAVLSQPVAEGGASYALTFGAIGSGCGYRTSSWQQLAWETSPAQPLTWPPRSDWHPGTDASALLEVMHARLPAAALPVLPADRAPCVAIVTVDAAVRDLLPLVYDAAHVGDAAAELRKLRPLDEVDARRQAAQAVWKWWQKQAPMQEAMPVVRAFDSVVSWSYHPRYALRSVEAVAQAFADVTAAHVPGADGALRRWIRRLDALRGTPAHCGLR